LKLRRFVAALAGCSALAVGVVACGDDNNDSSGSGGTSTAAADNQNLSGAIRIDGSSTVQPIAEGPPSCSTARRPT
jgi:ABC-type phosphate transport system substrate-binding protein